MPLTPAHQCGAFQDDHQLNVAAQYPVALFNPEVVMVFRYIIRSIQITNLTLAKE